MRVQTNCVCKKNLGPKQLWFQNKFGPKIFLVQTNFWFNKLWGQKISVQNVLGPKEFGVRIICVKNLWGYRKFEYKKWWVIKWSPCTLSLDHSVYCFLGKLITLYLMFIDHPVYCGYGSPWNLWLMITLYPLTMDNPVYKARVATNELINNASRRCLSCI